MAWRPTALALAGMVLFAALGTGCGSDKASKSATDVEPGLVVYATKNSIAAREKAENYGLPIKTLKSGVASTELIATLLNIPAGNDFYVVINPTNRRPVATGGLDPNGDPHEEALKVEQQFRNLAQVNQAGKTQSARLKPHDDSHARLLIFSDYQCPYCRMFAGIIPPLKSQFGDRLEVDMVNFPLTQIHPNAFPAAEAAECARAQGKFEPYQNALFAQQQALRDETYRQIAQAQHLDMKLFRQCTSLHQQRRIVRQDQYFGYYMGVQGTPSLFLNGKPLQLQNMSPESLAQAIQAELSH